MSYGPVYKAMSKRIDELNNELHLYREWMATIQHANAEYAQGHMSLKEYLFIIDEALTEHMNSPDIGRVGIVTSNKS